MKSEDVVQVTWQKISPERNLATNSKYFNPRVNPAFRDKVEFKDAGLQNSTLIIRNVNQQDEGCYNCLFNIQHQGAITCKTCLQIYGKNLPASLNVCETLQNQILVQSTFHDFILNIQQLFP
uniref:Ig-like domain-containing protein n=1 Tax=Sphaeramia orbicularis TaxID=375764 RepID=A0A672YL51_9TELE